MESTLLFGCLSIPFLVFGKRIYPYLIRRTVLKQQNEAKKFVIVTGATDGIGKEYVKYLSRNYNYNIVALGRNQKKLQQLVSQSEVRSLKNVVSNFVLPVRIDFSQNLSYQKSLSQITKKIIQKYQIIKSSRQAAQRNKTQAEIEQESEYTISEKFEGIINCCGTSMFDQFNSLSASQIATINNVNINSTILSLKFLSFFNQKNQQNRKQQIVKPSFFINLSSMVSTKNVKFLSFYAAAKSYQDSIIYNYAYQINKPSSKIRILNVQPWYVKTKMTHYMNTWDSIQAIQIVQNSFSLLYWRKINAIGSIKHQTIDFLFPFLKSYFLERSDINFQKAKKIKEALSKKRKK